MYVRVQKVRQGGRVYEYVHIVEGYRDDDGKVIVLWQTLAGVTA